MKVGTWMIQDARVTSSHVPFFSYQFHQNILYLPTKIFKVSSITQEDGGTGHLVQTEWQDIIRQKKVHAKKNQFLTFRSISNLIIFFNFQG